MAVLERAQLTRTRLYAIAEGVLASVLCTQGDYYHAKRVAEHAVALGKETIGPLVPRYGILLTTLARIMQETGDLHHALQLCQQAAHIFAQAGETSRIELGSAYHNLAVLYALRGEPRRALDTANMALAIWQPVLPPEHPFVVYALSTKVVAYQKLKAFREAEGILPELLRLADSQFRANRGERVILLNTAAAIYIATKKYSHAEPILHEAVAVGRAEFPVGHPLLGSTLRTYSDVLEKMNRKEEAIHIRAEAEVLLVSPRK